MTIEQYNGIVVQNIKRIIYEKGLKQRIIARRIGMSEKAFSEILRNRRLIKATDIACIASALGVEPNDLFATLSEQKKDIETVVM